MLGDLHGLTGVEIECLGLLVGAGGQDLCTILELLSVKSYTEGKRRVVCQTYL